MFKGIGYNEDVDWWSLGITFYECIYGTVRTAAVHIRVLTVCFLI
jgi:serine/threonine protein kinase